MREKMARGAALVGRRGRGTLNRSADEATMSLLAR